VNVIVLIARVVLVAVFAVAGLAKLADLAGSRKSLLDFGVPASLVSSGAVLLPVIELACAIALVSSSWVRWGATGALVLLTTFTAAVAVNLARGRRPDCHCFGQVHAAPIGWSTVARNVMLALLAAFVVSQASSAGLDAATALSSAASIGQVDGVVLGVAVAALILGLLELWIMVHLLRQNGRLLLRIDALEARHGGAPGQAQAAGLPIGVEAPAFKLPALEGGETTLGALVGQGRALLLVFLEQGCGACDALMPELALWQRTHAERLLVVPVSRGDAQVNRAKAIRHGLDHVLLQSDREVASVYRVAASPSAVLVRQGLIASDLSAGADAIRALVLWATAPEPLKKGAKIPSLGLADLNGGTVDLSTLLGRRTLLLFWNPACGFCQRMLDDLKAWETSRASAAPDLVVVSTGTAQANKSQGLRSRVVLDSQSAVAQLLGSGGTPSAVMLDEQGRVASDIGVGAAAVFALANSTTASEEVPA